LRELKIRIAFIVRNFSSAPESPTHALIVICTSQRRQMMHFTIPIPPRTKKNHSQVVIRRSKAGRLYGTILPSKQYRDYLAKCAPFIPRLEIDYPVNIKAVYYEDTRRVVDITNLQAALHDILVEYGCVVDDNSKIIVSTDGSRVSYDKENPRTEVWIERVEE